MIWKKGQNKTNFTLELTLNELHGEKGNKRVWIWKEVKGAREKGVYGSTVD